MNPLSFIFQNSKLIALLVLILAVVSVVFYVKHLKNEISDLKNENVVLTQKLSISNDSIKVLQNSVNDQNTALQNLKIESDKKAKDVAAALAESQKRLQNYKNIADALMKAQPLSIDNVCKSSDELINREIIRNAQTQ